MSREIYQVARRYMIRLEKSDLEDGEMKSRLAEAAGMTPDRFGERFGKVVELAGAV